MHIAPVYIAKILHMAACGACQQNEAACQPLRIVGRDLAAGAVPGQEQTLVAACGQHRPGLRDPELSRKGITRWAANDLPALTLTLVTLGPRVHWRPLMDF